jgi:hypothetical protein
LQDQAARVVLDDLLAHLAQTPVGLDWHVILASFHSHVLDIPFQQSLCQSL